MLGPLAARGVRRRVISRNQFPFRPVVDDLVLARSGAEAVRCGRATDVRLLIDSNLNEYDLFALQTPLTADPTARLMANVDSEALPSGSTPPTGAGLPSVRTTIAAPA